MSRPQNPIVFWQLYVNALQRSTSHSGLAAVLRKWWSLMKRVFSAQQKERRVKESSSASRKMGVTKKGIDSPRTPTVFQSWRSFQSSGKVADEISVGGWQQKAGCARTNRRLVCTFRPPGDGSDNSWQMARVRCYQWVMWVGFLTCDTFRALHKLRDDLGRVFGMILEVWLAHLFR